MHTSWLRSMQNANVTGSDTILVQYYCTDFVLYELCSDDTSALIHSVQRMDLRHPLIGSQVTVG